MNARTAQFSDVIRQSKGVSASFTLRLQICFRIPADFLVRIQGQHGIQKAFHSKGAGVCKEVMVLAGINPEQ